MGKGENRMSESFEERLNKNGCYHCAVCRFYHGLRKGCELSHCAYVSKDVAVAEHNKAIEYLSKGRERIEILYTQALGKIVDLKKERDEQKNKLLLPLKEILEELRKNLQLDVTPGWGYYDDKIGTILKLIDEKLTVEC
jgi:hypothetical protein